MWEELADVPVLSASSEGCHQKLPYIDIVIFVLGIHTEGASWLECWGPSARIKLNLPLFQLSLLLRRVRKREACFDFRQRQLNTV